MFTEDVEGSCKCEKSKDEVKLEEEVDSELELEFEIEPKPSKPRADKKFGFWLKADIIAETLMSPVGAGFKDAGCLFSEGSDNPSNSENELFD